jgi:hypothetical protein
VLGVVVVVVVMVEVELESLMIEFLNMKKK